MTRPSFPPPENGAGWPYLSSPGEIRQEAGLTPWRVETALRLAAEAAGPHSFGVVIIRNGVLVAEAYSRNVAHRTRFDLWSCTKSLTALAWGLLLADPATRTPAGDGLSLETIVYPLLPDAYPLSDPRKEEITIGHLLSMTSGIKGESISAGGMPTLTTQGIFEYAYGHVANRFGQWVAELSYQPGGGWDYSDPGFSHLSSAFAAVAGREMRDYME